MKKIVFLFSVLLFISSCKPKDDISYSKDCYYGYNVLLDGGWYDTLEAYQSYSFCANLEKDASLFVVI
ncbi:MAG: hypothetical protein LRY27_01260 [Chitinophagales bacterium]|nr:hypothetical protein [Chitinophagales bacterium]